MAVWKKPRRKGMRTAYLRSHSAAYINTGRTPNPIHMDEWRQRQKDAASDPFHVGPGIFAPTKTIKFEGVRFEGIDQFHKVCILEGKRVKRWLLFQGLQFLFIETDAVLKQEKRSIVYPDRDSAYAAHDRERICWVAFA